MSNYSFYLIFSGNLKDEFDVKPGSYRNECIIRGKFDFSKYKYLLGIGNICNGIQSKVIYSYILTRYMNGELSDEEVILLFRRYSAFFADTGDFAKDEDALDKFLEYNVNAPLFLYGQDCNLIDFSCSATDEQLIDMGLYDRISHIIHELGFDIGLYDEYGYSFNPERSLEIAKGMQSYVRENRQDYDTYGKSLKKIREEIIKRASK